MRAAKRVVVLRGRIVTPYRAGKPFRVDAPRVVLAIVEFNRDHLAHKGELILFKLLQREPRKITALVLLFESFMACALLTPSTGSFQSSPCHFAGRSR